mmetsp:Transcript_27299/g.53197  ORF Transcript_27299/g.53197 Transcript_27299/m.53197 type:complete len:224 (-) Transcript_27299:516-1187(-)
MLSVVIHVPEVEPNKGGRPGRARVTAPVFVVVLAVEVVGDVEKCVARLAKQHRQRPVSGECSPAVCRGDGSDDGGVEGKLQPARVGDVVAHKGSLGVWHRVKARVANDLSLCAEDEHGQPRRPDTKPKLASPNAEDLRDIALEVARHGIVRAAGKQLGIPRRIIRVRVMVLVEHALPHWVCEPRQRHEPRYYAVVLLCGEGGVVDALVLGAVSHGDHAKTHYK